MDSARADPTFGKPDLLADGPSSAFYASIHSSIKARERGIGRRFSSDLRRCYRIGTYRISTYVVGALESGKLNIRFSQSTL